MKVIKAKSAGFCFGVKRAVDTVYKQVEENQNLPIYTYGPIIHNEEVVKDLEAERCDRPSQRRGAGYTGKGNCYYPLSRGGKRCV